MNRIALPFVLCVAACVFVGCASDKSKSEAPFFPLGVWYEGGVGNARDNVLPSDPEAAAPIYDKNFADIAAHGINVITVPNSPPEHHKLILDTARRHGLKVILELGLDGGSFGHMIRGDMPMDDQAIQETLDYVLGPIKNHPALYRVQLLDEPPGNSFDRYGHIAAMTRAFNPRTEPFCCLTGGSDGGKFLDAAHSDVVAFDDYPIGPGVKEGDAAPLRGFAQVAAQFRKWATAHNASAWAVVQCHAITGQLRFPTDAEVSAMTWSALAEGDRGVFWFLYQSESVGSGTMMDGLVDREFKSRRLWDEVAALSKQLKPLTPILADLRNLQELKTDNQMLLARTLKNSKGKQYVIVVNLDALKPHPFTPSGGKPIELPPGAGQLLPIEGE